MNGLSRYLGRCLVMRQGLSMVLTIFISGLALAQDPPSAAAEQGALAYSNWTSSDAGGSAVLPTFVESQDYILCKACHSWDRMSHARNSKVGL